MVRSPSETGVEGEELGLENPFVTCTAAVNLITQIEGARSSFPQAWAGALRPATVGQAAREACVCFTCVPWMLSTSCEIWVICGAR